LTRASPRSDEECRKKAKMGDEILKRRVLQRRGLRSRGSFIRLGSRRVTGKGAKKRKVAVLLKTEVPSCWGIVRERRKVGKWRCRTSAFDGASTKGLAKG